MRRSRIACIVLMALSATLVFAQKAEPNAELVLLSERKVFKVGELVSVTQLIVNRGNDPFYLGREIQFPSDVSGGFVSKVEIVSGAQDFGYGEGVPLTRAPGEKPPHLTADTIQSEWIQLGRNRAYGATKIFGSAHSPGKVRIHVEYWPVMIDRQEASSLKFAVLQTPLKSEIEIEFVK